MSVPTRPTWPALALGLMVVAGCDQPTGSTKPRTSTPPVEVAEQAPPPAEKPREFIVGKTTQDIRESTPANNAGGVVTPPRITAKDPITLQGNAYVVAMGQVAINNIKHAVDLYQAETGEFPKTHDEFMEKIIKANNIALPKLPPYQEYRYDVASHSLQVIEYPDRR